MIASNIILPTGITRRRSQPGPRARADTRDEQLLSFNHLFYGEQGTRFWGDGFFVKYDFGVIGFVSPDPDWFPEGDMQRAVGAIRAELARVFGERLVSYGVGMGGYTALKYATLLGVDAAIAFSPQISFNPADVARFDPRYIRYYDPTRNGEMRIHAEDIAGKNYVLFDNFWTVDRKHAEQVTALWPVEHFALPFTGHASVRSIAEGHIARPFLLRLVGASDGKAAELRGIVRRTRRSTQVYWESRAVSLTSRRPAATRQILRAVRGAVSLAPDAATLRIALVRALLDCGERSEAEQELAPVHLGTRGPIGQWIRYIDCYRRIHGERATLEMLGRAPSEMQSHTAFHFEDAVIRFDMGDGASASAILSLIWPEQEQITRRMKLGILLNATGEKEKALGIFRALAEEVPNAENLIQLAVALGKDKPNTAARTEALTHLAEARKIIDPDPALWRRVLLLYDRLEVPGEQVAAGREAVAALPGYPDLRMELAIALERSGKHAEALELAARLMPEHARIRHLDWLILVLRKGEMGAEALRLARSAVEEWPDDSASRLQLAVLLLERGDEEEAFAHLLHVRAHPPGRLDLMADAVAAFDAVGLHADAAKAAGPLAAIHEGQFAPQLLLADRLIRAGFLQEARIHLRRIRRNFGNDAANLSAIATRYRRVGEERRAEELFARALGSNPRAPASKHEHAAPEVQKEEFRPAHAAFQGLPAANAGAASQTTAQMELIALSSQQGGRRGLAEARCAAAGLAKQNSQDSVFWAQLADLFASLDQPSQTLPAIGRAIGLAPGDPTHRLRQAELLLGAGRHSEAKSKLADLIDGSTTSATFARVVAAFDRMRDIGAAQAAAERWVAANPRDPNASTLTHT